MPRHNRHPLPPLQRRFKRDRCWSDRPRLPLNRPQCRRSQTRLHHQCPQPQPRPTHLKSKPAQPDRPSQIRLPRLRCKQRRMRAQPQHPSRDRPTRHRPWPPRWPRRCPPYSVRMLMPSRVCSDRPQRDQTVHPPRRLSRTFSPLSRQSREPLHRALTGRFSDRVARPLVPQPDQLPTAASDQRPRLPDRLSRTPCSAPPIARRPLRQMSPLRDRRHPTLPLQPQTARRLHPMRLPPMCSDKPSPPVAGQQPPHNPLFHPLPVLLALPVQTHWPCNARTTQRERQAEQICRTPLQRHQFNQRR